MEMAQLGQFVVTLVGREELVVPVVPVGDNEC